MTPNELARTLSEMYHDALEDEAMTTFHHQQKEFLF